MRLEHGDDTFTDEFLLVCENGEWRIANKVYHREARMLPEPTLLRTASDDLRAPGADPGEQVSD